MATTVVIKELPSIWFICRCRTVILIVCQLLASYQLSKAEKCGQIHTDGMGRRQTTIINLIISVLGDEEHKYISILLSASILPEDKTAEGQFDAIMSFLDEKKEWLKKRADIVECDYPNYMHDIDPDGICLSKLTYGGSTMTDACAMARKLNRMLVSTIINAGKEKSNKSPGEVLVKSIDTASGSVDSADVTINEDELVVNNVEDELVVNNVGKDMEGGDSDDGVDNVESNDDKEDVKEIDENAITDNNNTPKSSNNPDPVSNIFALEAYCHHHIRNVWWAAVDRNLTKFLCERLAGHLEGIDARLRINTSMCSLLRAADKNFSLPANYAKGDGKEFGFGGTIHHENLLLYPVMRTNGARHDMIIGGACAIYMNAWVYKQFLDEKLKTPDADNILCENLFIILSSVEMIALTHVCAILHFAVNRPMRWLAGHTHKLAKYDWSMRSMSQAIDILHDAFLRIEKGDNKITDESFMMNIFSPLTEKLPPFQEYMKYVYEIHQSPKINNSQKSNLATLVKRELFDPKRPENIESMEMTEMLGVITVTSVITEMKDPSKVTSAHMSTLGGQLSWSETTTKEHEATKGYEATNDKSEGPFGSLTFQMDTFTTIGIGNSSAVGQARINKDFYRAEVELGTRKNIQHVGHGTFINLDIELAESALKFALAM